MNIVIRSPNWIGDCVMALPAIRLLKKKVPDADIYIVAKNYLCSIYDNIEEIREVIPISDCSSWMCTFSNAKKLKRYRFKNGILFTNSISSAILFRLAGIKNLTGYCKDLRGFLLSKKLPFPKNNKHHMEFYLDLVTVFTSSPHSGIPSFQLSISAEEKENAANKLKAQGRETTSENKPILVGISPSAAYGTAKQWLQNRFSTLIIRMKQKNPEIQVLLFGSEKEREKIEKIIEPVLAEVEHKEKWLFNLAGKLSLRESIATISLCDAFISNDSGLMHVASSLNLPLVAIFGPTRPDKTGPRNPQSRVIYHPTQCAPCLDRDCPYEDHPCMTAITVEEVLGTLESLIFSTKKKVKKKTGTMPRLRY